MLIDEKKKSKPTQHSTYTNNCLKEKCTMYIGTDFNKKHME